MAKFRKGALLFSMNDVKRLAKESAEINVLEVIRQVRVIFLYCYYHLYYNFSWKKLGLITFHLSGRFLNYFQNELFF